MSFSLRVQVKRNDVRNGPTFDPSVAVTEDQAHRPRDYYGRLAA